MAAESFVKSNINESENPLLKTHFTHIRLNIFPDGGVARLRLYGQPAINLKGLKKGSVLDLAAAHNGARAIAWSDAHYGHPKNLLHPGRGINMADGWETSRRKDRPSILKQGADGHIIFPGYEWAVINLAGVGEVQQIEVDTCHFKGNFPEAICIDGLRLMVDVDSGLTTRDYEDRFKADVNSFAWKPILPRTKLAAHKIHHFSVKDYVSENGLVDYVRVTIFPDGGVSRIRLKGTLLASYYPADA